MKGLTIKSGSVRVRIFANRSGKYVRHELRWTDHHGRRRRLKRSNLADARREAKGIADDLARGHHRSALTLADLASFRAGIVNLFGTGKTLELATAEVAEVHKLLLNSQLPTSQLPSLSDLARHWLETRALDIQCPTLSVSEAVEKFLLEIQARGMSARYVEDLTHRLRRFAKEHPEPLRQLTAGTVQTWILRLKVAPRTRNNFLGAIQTLLAEPAYAALPHAAAIRAIKRSVTGHVSKLVWTPDEMRTILSNAVKFDVALVPVLALGAFGKLRASEAAHAIAADLRLDDRQMLLRTGKTGARLIPLPENCAAWLRAYAPKDGPLWPWSIDAMNARLRKLAVRCELKWRPNALRKSANTYALLLDPDYARVAREAGNSPKMLREYYAAVTVATKSDAEQWFAILPTGSARTVININEALAK